MKNKIQDGDVLEVTAPATLVSGQAFLLGALFLIATRDAASGEKVDAARHGVFELPKATGVAGAEGAKAYWDDTAKKITPTSTDNKLVGAFVNKSYINADTKAAVLLTGVLV